MDSFAEIIDMSKTTVSGYEEGVRVPDAVALKKIVNHFKIGYYEFIETDLEAMDSISSIDNEYAGLTHDQLIAEIKNRDSRNQELSNRILEMKKKVSDFIQSQLG